MPSNRPPLRQYGFRVLAPAVGAIIGATVAVLVGPALHKRGFQIPEWILLIILAAFVVVLGAAVVVGVVGRRGLVNGRIEVAMRVPGGKWTHGRLQIEPGTLTFERYRLQMRLPSGDVTTYRVSSVGEDIGRRPALRNVWTINPQLHVIEVETNLGRREIAALPSRVPELRERVSGTYDRQ